MAQRQKFPFRGNARQRIQRVVQTRPIVIGGRDTIELPRVGYLAGIHVQLAGGITRAGGDTGTLNDQFANFVRRLQVNLNIGSSQIYDVSGHGTNLLNQAMSFNYSMDGGGAQVPQFPQPVPLDLTADSSVFQFDPTAPAVNSPLVLTYWIPIAMNDGLNFNVGLINLQAPEVRCTLDLSYGNVADLFTPGAVIAGTTVQANVNVHYLYYEVPNPDLVEMPPYIVHRVVQERQAISAVGDQVYTVPRMGQLQRLIHSVQINGLLATNLVTDLSIRVNKTDDIYRMTQSMNRFLSRMRYGHKVPEGAFYHDWWRAADLNAAGDYRDVIDSEQISTLESIVGINGNAVLGQGNNFLDTIREFTQRLA